MKKTISFLIILLPLMGCDHRKHCKLVLYPDKGIITAELQNMAVEAVYLDNRPKFSIYKLSSDGNYTDWNNNHFISMITSGLANEYKTPNEFKVRPISKIAYDSLIERYINIIDDLDSVSLMSTSDFLDIHLSSMVFLEKGDKLLNSFALFPLLEVKGSYKIVCSYSPIKGINSGSGSFYFSFPAKIDGYKRLDSEIFSDTLYIVY